MSYLLAGGCSYTVKNLHYGDYTADWDIWPEILGKKLNLTPVVYASGGLTNTLILEYIIDHLNQFDKPNMICIQLSDWSRISIGKRNYIPHWKILQYLYRKNKIKWEWINGRCCMGEGLREDILPEELNISDYLVEIKFYTEIWKKLNALVDICLHKKIPLYIIQGLGVVTPTYIHNLHRQNEVCNWDHLRHTSDNKIYLNSIESWFNKMWNMNKTYERFNKNPIDKPWNYPCFKEYGVLNEDGNIKDNTKLERESISDNIYSKKLEKLNKESKYINLIGWPWDQTMGGRTWCDRVEILGKENYLITKDNKIIDDHPGARGQELFVDMFLESNIKRMAERKNK